MRAEKPVEYTMKKYTSNVEARANMLDEHARKNFFNKSCSFVLLVLDIDWTHADNAECHHNALSRS